MSPASLNDQEEITSRLGAQVRQAVELLVAAFGRAGVDARVAAQEVYRGAVTVMMRIVFLLFAEECGLLPADSELYALAYSAGGLYAGLERRVAGARGNEGELEHTFLAWPRLLALFTVVYRGVSHPGLDLVAHDGSLFAPTAHPWLPLTVDDRTVLHLLRAVQTVTIGGELRTVSFRTLTVEQIGYVYEGLLSFEGFRAAETVVGLTGREGREEEVPLAALEAIAAGHVSAETLAAELAGRYKESGIGSARALTARLAPLTGDERAQAQTRLYAVTGGDDRLVQRLLPFYRVIRQDLRGDPVVILPGALYVTESALRASTGTHYTPRFLAEQVAEGALEPLVYSPGPLQTADRSAWKLRTPGEILALRVADIAMGSGAFLVAACRYLAGKLIEAWSAAGSVDADVAADPLVIRARRQVIEHCLYGVDINPMAVEMAKLSLWLVSMDPRRPFTFLDDRLACGDSLLGITSIDQLEWMHLDPAAGRGLHEGTLLDFMSGVRSLLAEVTEQRTTLADLPDLTEKRQILADVQAKTEQLARFADLLVGAALAGSGQGGLWLTAARIAGEAAAQDAFGEAREQAAKWLATDQPDGAFDRQPLHWPLVFPEVFGSSGTNGPGFDAIIGNPPFLGGSKISGSAGGAYREHLVFAVANGLRGNADLVAYFLLRAHVLLNPGGQTGLIATNTLAQGDTREVGLDQVVATGAEIRQAIKSKPWPSRSAVLEYAALWTSRHRLEAAAGRSADGLAVKKITPSLDPASRVSGNPERLAANVNIQFEGSKIYGAGFTLSPAEARQLTGRDPRNSAVLFPYLGGQDLNSNPSYSPERWVINFHGWPEETAKTYTECYEQVRRQVRPERLKLSAGNGARERWWQYERRRPELYHAISRLDRVIVITLHTKTVMPAMVSSRQVFSHALAVFATDDTGFLALLSSGPHYWWAVERGSTLETRVRYTPSDVFETFPRPEVTAEMRDLGGRLDRSRRELMLARQAGLTALYNLVHDRGCTDADLAGLREIHRAIDEAVVLSYGWDDLPTAGLDHGFHQTRQGPRYTIGPAVRREILDRLLELNHERYAAEVLAGLRDRRTRRRAVGPRGGPDLGVSGDSTLF